MILCIKHVAIEGPETIEVFFRKHHFQVKTIDLSAGDTLPIDEASSLDAVISLGGPMNVYEEEKYPFLKEEDEFLKKVIDIEVPFIGLCLGAQLLAKAAGGKVVRAPKREIGFSTVKLTKEAKTDTLFTGLPNDITVFQWHEEMFELPKGGVLLATSPDCPNQAFRVGPCAWGLQFHVEVVEKSIREWSDVYFKNDGEMATRRNKMLKDYHDCMEKYLLSASTMFRNFLGAIT